MSVIRGPSMREGVRRRRRKALDVSTVGRPICAVTLPKLRGLVIHGNSFSVVIFLIKGKRENS